MKILSLFDGISCGMVALKRAGIKVDKYYASEIDKNAIEVSKNNHSDIIQLGDINNWEERDIGNIDMIIGGSPCQSFSQAGNKEGFEGKSGLFRKYIDILKYYKPKYFLLENVKMKKEWEGVITNTLKKIYPETNLYNINSKLVSAQLRNRFYRTNIQGVEQPKDKLIFLSDILETGVTDREKARAILESESRPLVDKEKMYRRYLTTGFTTIVYELSNYAKEKIKNRLGDKKGIVYNYYKDSISNDKSRCLTTNASWSNKSCDIVIADDIRYFTQTELERLQTLPEGYTRGLSRNKAAGLIGNGRTVDIISHIFNYLPKQ